jgi:N-acetylmuramoyl-L-alanine amidase
MSYRVFIGVGHGGSDPGASRYVVEKEANLTIALELRKQLEAAGIVVGMSRTKDENDPIGEEIREANAFAPIDIAVEIHNNAGNGDGFEVFVQTNQYAAKSRAAAQAIEAEVKAIGQRSRGIKNKVYGWTYSVKAPAVLLEGFFVDIRRMPPISIRWQSSKNLPVPMPVAC